MKQLCLLEGRHFIAMSFIVYGRYTETCILFTDKSLGWVVYSQISSLRKCAKLRNFVEWHRRCSANC